MPGPTDPPHARFVTGGDELKRLAGGWDRLAARSSPVESSIWTAACARTLARDDHLRVVVVGPEHEPRGIAPLIRRRRPFAPLEQIGVRELSEPMDFPCANPEAAAELVERLAEIGEPLLVTRTWADSPIVGLIEDRFGRIGRVHRRDAGSCPFIPLDPGWEEPESQLSSRRRSDLRRARRRAEQLGEVRAEVLEPGPDEVAGLLEEAFGIEARGWKGAARTALAEDRRRAAFYEDYARAAAARGELRVCFLRIGGRAAAMQLAVAAGGRFWLLKIGYDEEFARCSPGSLLIAETVRHAASAGMRGYELLGTSAAWTGAWTRDERACVQLRAYPSRPRSLATLATDAAGVATRRLLTRLGRSR